LISHNDRLIETIPEGELLFINNFIKDEGVLIPSPKDSYQLIKNELSSKLEAIKLNASTKCFIITEDEHFDLIKTVLDINNFNLDEVEIISYFGSSTIGAAIVIGKYIKEKNKTASILIHRDSDYLTDEELEELKIKVEREGFTFYNPIGVDIESEFINSNHINFLYSNLAISKIEDFIKEATIEAERDSIDRLLKHTSKSKREFGINVLDMYHLDNERYRYGKKVLGILKSLIQKELGINPIIINKSPFIQKSFLMEFSDKLWPNDTSEINISCGVPDTAKTL
jgi:hypothetical protein